MSHTPRVLALDSDFLVEQQVAPWMGLPLWLPDHMVNMTRVSVKKALNAGLRYRPLDETVQDTLEWYRSTPKQEWPAGISPDKEQEVLANWRELKKINN